MGQRPQRRGDDYTCPATPALGDDHHHDGRMHAGLGAGHLVLQPGAVGRLAVLVRQRHDLGYERHVPDVDAGTGVLLPHVPHHALVLLNEPSATPLHAGPSASPSPSSSTTPDCPAQCRGGLCRSPECPGRRPPDRGRRCRGPSACPQRHVDGRGRVARRAADRSAVGARTRGLGREPSGAPDTRQHSRPARCRRRRSTRCRGALRRQWAGQRPPLWLLRPLSGVQRP